MKAVNGATKVEGVEVGNILVSSWGWEQTNIDFYQVVKVTAKSVTVREVEKSKEWCKDESGKEDYTAGGYARPVKDSFLGDAFSRRFDNEYKSIRVCDRQIARMWGGKPERFTCYA